MRKNLGFTVIELIVVFAIVAILSTIGIASFVNYGRIQTVQSAVSDLNSSLNLAKSRAISQSKPPECANHILTGYRVNIILSNNTYNVEAVCSGITRVIQSNSLPVNVSFSSQTTSTSFLFPVIVSGVQGAGTIVITGYGQTKTITVDSIGGIK